MSMSLVRTRLKFAGRWSRAKGIIEEERHSSPCVPARYSAQMPIKASGARRRSSGRDRRVDARGSTRRRLAEQALRRGGLGIARLALPADHLATAHALDMMARRAGHDRLRGRSRGSSTRPLTRKARTAAPRCSVSATVSSKVGSSPDAMTYLVITDACEISATPTITAVRGSASRAQPSTSRREARQGR